LEWLAFLSSPSILVSAAIWFEWSGRIDDGIGTSKRSRSIVSNCGLNFSLHLSVVSVNVIFTPLLVVVYFSSPVGGGGEAGRQIARVVLAAAARAPFGRSPPLQLWGWF
jgi:hypothetical protein